jgi:hypothetical protein
VRPTVVKYIGREVAQHECECLDGYAGTQCTILVPQQQKSIGLGYVLGLGITVIVTLSILGMLLFCFAAMRNKRASHGHYSPSSQEMAGTRTEHVGYLHANPIHAFYAPIHFRSTACRNRSATPAPSTTGVVGTTTAAAA